MLQPDYATKLRALRGERVGWVYTFRTPPVPTTWWTPDDWITYIGDQWWFRPLPTVPRPPQPFSMSKMENQTMTEAKIIPAKLPVTRLVIVREGTDEQVVLTMSRKDAEVLRIVAALVGGSPEGPRGSIARIDNALHYAGVGYYDSKSGEELYELTARLFTSKHALMFA